MVHFPKPALSNGAFLKGQYWVPFFFFFLFSFFFFLLISESQNSKLHRKGHDGFSNLIQKQYLAGDVGEV